MKILWLSINNILARPLSTILSLLLLTLGVGMISLILQVDRHIQDQMSNNIRGIDMVVGAKGSPLQLILSAVYHIDAPTGNIPVHETKRLLKNRLIEFGIPLSYGDSYEGYRIVGTDPSYPELYKASLQKGKLWSKTFEVTVGATVAERLELQLGDTFVGSHGFAKGGEVHDEFSYRVVGIFNRSNSVLDQLILTPLESVWDSHHHEEDGHEDDHDDLLEEEDEREITAMLIGFRSPTAMIQIPRMVNEKTSMQAAVPAYEIDRLFGLMGVSVEVLKYIAITIMVVSGLSIFISLFSTLKERKYELAVMRTFGASRGQLLWVVLQEGLILTGIGFVLGIISGRIGLASMSALMEVNYHYSFSIWSWIPEEWILLLVALAIGLIASIIPAINAYKLNISKTLADA